jgi:hypothetical protein
MTWIDMSTVIKMLGVRLAVIGAAAIAVAAFLPLHEHRQGSCRSDVDEPLASDVRTHRAALHG